MEWQKINLKDFVKIPHQAKVSIYTYEISELGEVRLYNPLGSVVRYKKVKTNTIAGVEYLSLTLYTFQGTVVRTTIPIKRILDKCF